MILQIENRLKTKACRVVVSVLTVKVLPSCSAEHPVRFIASSLAVWSGRARTWRVIGVLERYAAKWVHERRVTGTLWVHEEPDTVQLERDDNRYRFAVASNVLE